MSSSRCARADADTLRLAVVAVDHQQAIVAQRQLVLADLVAFGQVGVAVVLAREDAERRNLAVQCQPAPHRLLDRVFIDNRQHAGHGQTDRADVAVGRRLPVVCAARAEHLGGGLKLRVDLHADDGVVGLASNNSGGFSHGFLGESAANCANTVSAIR